MSAVQNTSEKHAHAKPQPMYSRSQSQIIGPTTDATMNVTIKPAAIASTTCFSLCVYCASPKWGCQLFLSLYAMKPITQSTPTTTPATKANTVNHLPNSQRNVPTKTKRTHQTTDLRLCSCKHLGSSHNHGKWIDEHNPRNQK
jgi:hypothetical protein